MPILAEFVRTGHQIFTVVRGEDGRPIDTHLKETFKSISKAKKWSREYQQANGGIGRGSVRVDKPKKATKIPLLLIADNRHHDYRAAAALKEERRRARSRRLPWEGAPPARPKSSSFVMRDRDSSSSSVLMPPRLGILPDERASKPGRGPIRRKKSRAST